MQAMARFLVATKIKERQSWGPELPLIHLGDFVEGDTLVFLV
jgi:hypothetical protein